MTILYYLVVDSNKKTLLALCLILAILNVIGALYPSVSNWGFNHWSVLDQTIALASIIVITLIAFLPTAKVSPPLSTESKSNNRSSIAWPAVSVVVLLAILWAFRSRALVYGDGYTVLGHVAEAGDRLIFDQYNLQIGSILIKRYLYLALSSLFGISAEHFYSIFNVLGGAVGTFAVWHIAESLGKSTSQRVVLFLGGMTSCSVLLFFGHIEHYTWPLSLGLWSTAYCIKVAISNRGGFIAILFGLGASILHLIALPFLGVSMLIVFAHTKNLSIEQYKRFFTLLSIGGVLFSVLLVAFTHNFNLPEIFIPFTTHELNNYALFTWSHTRDTLNLLIFASPLVLLVPFLLSKRGRESLDVSAQLLILTGLYAFLPVFWIDPALGMVRDFDLLVLFGIPLSLGILYWFLKTTDVNPAVALLPITAIALLQLIPNVYEKIDLNRSVEYLDKMLWDDPHYQKEYHKGYRNQSWARLLRINANRPELAEKYFDRHITADPEQAYTWNHLGELAFERGDIDSAAACYRRSLEILPDQAGTLHRLAQSYDLLGMIDSALTNIIRAVELSPESFIIAQTCGVILYHAGHFDSAISELHRSIALGADAQLSLYDIGLCYQSMNQLDSAYSYFASTLQFESGRPEFLKSLMEVQIELGKKNEAKAVFPIWLRSNPPRDSVMKYQAILES